MTNHIVILHPHFLLHKSWLFINIIKMIPSQVRDRATLFLDTLGDEGRVVDSDTDVKDFLFGSLDVPLLNLENSLKNYVSDLS